MSSSPPMPETLISSRLLRITSPPTTMVMQTRSPLNV
ncbi:hypothetical protein EVA_10064 [gut metagenome]|uniref:Uncharacterized protein n=1 Tax=gut metagenome TaxID=749906 RepID=J9G4N8_9ZZZZ